MVVGLGVAQLFGAIRPGFAADRQYLRGQLPEAVSHLQSLGRLPGAAPLQLAIGLPLRNEPALNQLIQEMYDPASPNYHRYLMPEQFAEQFGPTAEDYQAVIDFARANGLTVTGTHPNRVILDVSGSVAAVEKAFHVTLRTFRHPREARDFFSPDAEPSIDLNVSISHVSGLDNFVIPRPASLKRKLAADSPMITPASGSAPGGLYLGNDFRAAYAPGVMLNGTGQSVALLELDGYNVSDITNYEGHAGFPNITLTNILIDGFSGAAGANNVEVALDIEVARSMAPGLAKIIVYEGPNPGNPADILNRMATDNAAKQISSSWLIGDNSSYVAAYKQFATQGQSFFQASGDDGAYYSGIGQSADDTNVTLVGGTTLFTTGPGGAYTSETVWNWYSTKKGTGVNGGGGGISLNSLPIPTWQLGINMTTNLGSTAFRNSPDVALTADDIFVVADGGANYTVGGTSAAAPLWAGFTALINQQAAGFGAPTVGFLNPAVYTIGKSAGYSTNFHDITAGNNTNTTVSSKYYAVPGYDLCTGWGSPNGQNLINTLVPPDVLGLTPLTGFNASGAIGGPFTTTVQTFTLTNSGAALLNWQAASTSSWLTVSPLSGSLAAAGQTIVTVSLNSAASNLVSGTYTATVWLTNQTSGVVQNRQFSLQVAQPLAISPATGFTASGPAGGPFNISAQNFSLTNLGATSLSWSLINTSLWLYASPTGGALAPGGPATTVTVGLNAAANTLVTGIYSASLWFSNVTGHAALSLSFTLQVGQSIVQNGGFETGSFSAWTLTGDTASGIDTGLNSGISPHSGSFLAALGEPNALGYLSQTLSTVSNQDYLLSLWLNSPDAAVASGGLVAFNTPNEFSVSWNGATIFDQVNMGPIGWTNLVFVVTATSASTALQFGERVDPWYFGLDDINVWPIPNPSFRSLVRTNGNKVVFSWNALAGLAYQVQYSTNLTKTNWIVLSTNNATGPILTFTNTYGTDPRRFYRIRRLP